MLRPPPHIRTRASPSTLSVHVNTHFWVWGTLNPGCKIAKGKSGKLGQFRGTSNSSFPPQPPATVTLPNPLTAIPCVMFKRHSCIHWGDGAECTYSSLHRTGVALCKLVQTHFPKMYVWDDGHGGSFLILESTCMPTHYLH